MAIYPDTDPSEPFGHPCQCCGLNQRDCVAAEPSCECDVPEQYIDTLTDVTWCLACRGVLSTPRADGYDTPFYRS